MKLIDSILYIEWSEMVDCGVSDGYLKKAKSVGTKCWTFINDPKDNRRVLIHYEDLKQEYKDRIITRYGNPYDQIARTPILNSVQNRPEANAFYMAHRFDGDKKLDIETVNKYTRADAWLTYINTMGLREIKDLFPGMKVPDFYSHVTALINIEKDRGKDKTYSGIYQLPGEFPATYQRLKTKAENYRNGTFEDLINPSYGNKNSTKLGRNDGGFDPELHEKQMAVIRAVAAKHNNFDASEVKKYADIIFNANGWETIKASRIRQVLAPYRAALTPGRRGSKEHKNNIAMQVKRLAPQSPTYYWTLDGWTVELLYQSERINEAGKRYMDYNGRLTVVVVLDPYNKYPVGFAIGDRETPDLIKEAVRNAVDHVHQLFGAPDNGCRYTAHQLQSDNYQIKNLTPFYQAASHVFTPAGVGASNSKVIEPYFKYLNKTYCKPWSNWSGYGITANKKNQVNREYLNKIKHTFPNKEGAIMQVMDMMNRERSAKIEQYREGWNNMDIDKRTVISTENMIMLFGSAIGNTNQITGQGIVKQIDSIKYTYNSFDPLFRKNMHLDWQLYVDNNDKTKVLAISPDNKLRFVLDEINGIPMDLRSRTEVDHAYQARVDAYNAQDRDSISKMYAEDAEIVEETLQSIPLQYTSHDETALKLMFTDSKGQQKEQIQNAKGLISVAKRETKRIKKAEEKQDANWQQLQTEYLTKKVDFNQFKD
ncbi:hypothetical protein D3C72_434520 [compost metagenome]